MNIEQVKQVYRKAGFCNDSIEQRIMDIEWVVKQNPHQSKSGTGGGMILDHNPFGESGVPLIVANDQEFQRVAKVMMADADTYAFNIPSSGVPQVFTTIWTTKMIEQLYKARTLDKVAGSWQQGAPGVQNIMIPTISFNGQASLYSDESMGGNTSINTNWVNRPVAYFEQSLNWGDMQQAMFSLAKIDYVGKLRDSMALTVSQFQNDLGFNGYMGVASGDKPAIFGVLNEPNLTAAISLPGDGTIPGTATATSKWIGKDFNKIVRDFRLMYQDILNKAAGNVSLTTRGSFLIPPSAYIALTTPNELSSVSVAEYLKMAFPSIELIQCPNFEDTMVVSGVQTAQTVGMLILDHPNGEKPFDELFVVKWQGHRPVQMASSVSEKISYGLGGAVLKYPYLVSYTYGI